MFLARKTCDCSGQGYEVGDAIEQISMLNPNPVIISGVFCCSSFVIFWFITVVIISGDFVVPVLFLFDYYSHQTI